jgi:hypothetical protein
MELEGGQMNRFGWIWVCAFALASPGAVAQEPPGFFSQGIWIMKPSAAAPVDPEQEPETRTAHVNEFLFVQEFTAAAEAVVETRVDLPVPAPTRWNSSPATVTLEPGAGLVLIGGVGRRAVFCDRRISFESRNWLDGRKLRACLVDEDRDGRFDRGMWAGAGEDLYAPMFIFGWVPQPLDVAYSLRTEGNARLISAGPVVTRSAFGAYRVAFAVSAHGAPVVLQDLHHTGGENRPDPAAADTDVDIRASDLYFRDHDPPISVDVFGARVEIVSVQGATVTYRVHSMFDATRPMRIGYSGSMPE